MNDPSGPLNNGNVDELEGLVWHYAMNFGTWGNVHYFTYISKLFQHMLAFLTIPSDNMWPTV